MGKRQDFLSEAASARSTNNSALIVSRASQCAFALCGYHVESFVSQLYEPAQSYIVSGDKPFAEKLYGDEKNKNYLDYIKLIQRNLELYYSRYLKIMKTVLICLLISVDCVEVKSLR